MQSSGPTHPGPKIRWLILAAASLGVAAAVIAMNLAAGVTTAADNGQSASNDQAVDEDEDVKLHAGSQTPYIHNINLYDTDGKIIAPNSNKPYSPIKTCGKCHNTDAMRHGWHHNAADPDFDADGRPGEPFFWVDGQSRAQLPLTARDWAGAYSLQTLGISPWQFTIRFGGRTPGGGLGAIFQNQKPKDDNARWDLTGQLQMDCLSCHLQNASYDMTAWHDAIDKHNFKWAPSAAAPFAKVKGAMTDVPDDYDPLMSGFGSDNPMPKVQYREQWFDGKTLLLGTKLTNDIPNQNCYQCHSKRPVGQDAMPRWHRQQDVHMAQGMSCVDCHRNGVNHATTRNYENDPALTSEAAHTLSCKGCHLGGEHSKLGTFNAGGRMAAPRPEHKGIPPLHFEEMSCTSCHAGPDTQATARRMQTSMGHKLGLSSEHRNHRMLPHMVTPVFVDNEAGKLAPHRAVWPAFWGVKSAAQAKDQDGEGDNTITPLPPQKAADMLEDVLPEVKHEDMWRPLSRKQIANALSHLDEAKEAEGTPVYVAGGKVFAIKQNAPAQRDEDNAAENAQDEDASDKDASSGPALTVTADHPAAKAYTWPLGHNVRPAPQSLGAGGCKDCHSADGPTDFAVTAAANWDETTGEAPTLPQQAMHEMRDQSPTMLNLWNRMFQGRTLFKVIALISTVLVFGVLLFYAGLGVRGLSRWATNTYTGRS